MEKKEHLKKIIYSVDPDNMFLWGLLVLLESADYEEGFYDKLIDIVNDSIASSKKEDQLVVWKMMKIKLQSLQEAERIENVRSEEDLLLLERELDSI